MAMSDGVRASCAMALAVSILCSVPAGVPPARAAQTRDAADASREAPQVWPIRDGLFLVTGSANVTVQIGSQGVLLVDTQRAADSEALLRALRTISTAPVRFVINTSIAPDHVGGNDAAAGAGQGSSGGRRPDVVPGAGGAPIHAFEAVLTRMVGENVPQNAWPTFTYFTERRDLFVNGEAVQLLHMPAAHTDGDTLVWFRRRDVISAGDLFTPHRYPVIDRARGGSINGFLDSLNAIIDLAIPERNQEGGTLIVPGHGRICDESDVTDYRDMVTIVRDRVRDLIARRFTLERILAAAPTREYDGLYATPGHTGDMFTEAIYHSLVASTGGAERGADRDAAGATAKRR